jgi:hypothetical protein
MPKPFLGYEEGDVLRDVTLAEARSWECNRCGGCCAGDLPDDVVKKDEATGLPLFVWTAENGLPEPEDLYASRYGRPMLQPLVMGDGGVVPGKAWERDADDAPFKAFRCSFLREDSDDHTTCTLKERFPDPDPRQPRENRPLHCGEFPIFTSLVTLAVREHGSFVPATGSLPKCTWHGIRIVREATK